jgi:hypothetical protein
LSLVNVHVKLYLAFAGKAEVEIDMMLVLPLFRRGAAPIVKGGLSGTDALQSVCQQVEEMEQVGSVTVDVEAARR